MKLRASVRAGLLASVAMAAGLAIQPASPDERAYVATELAAPAVADPGAAVEIAEVSPAAPLAGLAAFAVALAAAFNWKRLIRLARRAAPAARAAAGAIAAAPAAAVRIVAKAAAAPLRWASVLAFLALFSLLGFGIYDLEWVAGAIAGVAAGLLLWISSRGLRRMAARSGRSQPEL